MTFHSSSCSWLCGCVTVTVFLAASTYSLCVRMCLCVSVCMCQCVPMCVWVCAFATSWSYSFATMMKRSSLMFWQQLTNLSACLSVRSVCLPVSLLVRANRSSFLQQFSSLHTHTHTHTTCVLPPLAARKQCMYPLAGSTVYPWGCCVHVYMILPFILAALSQVQHTRSIFSSLPLPPSPHTCSADFCLWLELCRVLFSLHLLFTR